MNRERLLLYPGLIAVIYICWYGTFLYQAKNGVDPGGYPLGYDFIQFWSVSHIGLHESPVLAYDLSHLGPLERTIAPALKGDLPWRYPPMFYLLVLPFSLIPMQHAWVCFALGTLALYVWVFCQVIRTPQALLCLVCFGPLWNNLLAGQTGFLTAAFAAGALLCLHSRPILAGVLIGLLCIKPHLAVLFPLCLIAIGAWRAFFAAATTVAVFALISAAVLGGDTFTAFFHGLHEAQQWLAALKSPLLKMPSVFVGLIVLNAPQAWAFAVHGVVALLAAWTVWRIWRCCEDSRLRNAALMTGSLMISPYVFDYDMVWLVFPVAWLTLYCMEKGWRRFEREFLLLLWADTLFIATLAKHLWIHTTPIFLGMLLWLIYRHALGEGRRP
jgi:hypothetical protein